MKNNHKKIILKYVNKLVPNLRKPKYSSEYYLTNILTLLTTINSWEALTLSVNLDKKKPYHYKTVADIHRLWCDKGVYRKAYEEIRNNNTDYGDTNNKEKEFDLLIDSTLIINKYGSDYIGYGSETRKKKFTKVTILTDDKNAIINVIENKTQSKEIVFGIEKIKRKRGRPNKIEKMLSVSVEQEPKTLSILPKKNKTITITTLEHDVKGIIPILENTGIPKNTKINLIGDAGYIVGDETKKVLKKMNVTLITPYRKNQTKQNTATEKKKLKKRNAVERSISAIKVNNRIHVRKDRKLKNYMGFMYMGIINTF